MSGLAIPYNGPLHTRIRQAIRDRYDISRNKMREYYDRWEDAEEQYQAYIPETEGDARRRVKRENGEPGFTTIEIPYSYAIMMTAHTYWSTVFLGRSPVMQYSGRHGETEDQVLGLEALMDYQVNVGQMLVPFYVWLLDKAKYGIGIICDYWEDEKVVVSSIEERPVTYLGLPVPGKVQKVRSSKTISGYQGNKIFNVRPYDWFPDPRVPMIEFQRGEFCARKAELSWNEIVRGDMNGRYVNTDVLKKKLKAAQKQNDEEYGSTETTERPEKNIFADDLDLGFTTVVEMVIELVPKDWELGTSKYPEKWVFALAADEVVIEARPLGAWHAKFPYQILEYEIDGYSLIPRGMMELMQPLTDTMSWLFNSHFHNVRKVLNDQLIVDPSRIVMKDLMDPTSGRLIRLKPEAYGTDPRLSVHQLQTIDVTQNHLRDASLVADLIQRVTGVTDNIMGMVNAGGRKTASEVRISSSMATNRLKTGAEYDSALGWSPLSQMLLQNTQQYYTLERQYKIAGNMMGKQQMMDVTPDTIQGFFDFVPVDGTMPIDRFAMANVWRELMAQMAQMPPLLQTYDLGSIFAYVAKLAGAKNIDQFKIKVVDDGVMQQRAQAGAVIPIGGQGGGRTPPVGGRGVPGAAGNTPQVPEPGQVPGMGRTG